MLDEMLSNPLVKLALSAASSARERLERGVRSALQAANLPTSDDVEELKRRLGELETMLDDLGERLGHGGAGPTGGSGPRGGSRRG
jgi:polyhydroxyalkanoate synthesis regulator phasin